MKENQFPMVLGFQVWEIPNHIFPLKRGVVVWNSKPFGDAAVSPCSSLFVFRLFVSNVFVMLGIRENQHYLVLLTVN
jgi:hypothetical protein